MKLYKHYLATAKGERTIAREAALGVALGLATADHSWWTGDLPNIDHAIVISGVPQPCKSMADAVAAGILSHPDPQTAPHCRPTTHIHIDDDGVEWLCWRPIYGNVRRCRWIMVALFGETDGIGLIRWSTGTQGGSRFIGALLHAAGVGVRVGMRPSIMAPPPPPEPMEEVRRASRWYRSHKGLALTIPGKGEISHIEGDQVILYRLPGYPWGGVDSQRIIQSYADYPLDEQ